MNKKTLLTALAALLLGTPGLHAADYGINVAGVEVTTSNYTNVTGGNIASGTVKYDPNNKILTLTGVASPAQEAATTACTTATSPA